MEDHMKEEINEETELQEALEELKKVNNGQKAHSLEEVKEAIEKLED